jgi:hypothetical protein
MITDEHGNQIPTGEPYTLPDAETPGSVAVTDIPAIGADVSELDPESDPGIRKAQELRSDYQRAGQVRRALNEHRNAKSQDNAERMKAAKKDLAALGYEGDPEADTTEDDDTTPRGRTSRSLTKTDAPTTKDEDKTSSSGSAVKYSTSTPSSGVSKR